MNFQLQNLGLEILKHWMYFVSLPYAHIYFVWTLLPSYPEEGFIKYKIRLVQKLPYSCIPGYKDST